MAFLPVGTEQQSSFQLVQFDTSLLALDFNARIALRNGGFNDPTLVNPQDRGPAVIPPWQVPSEPETLNRRVNEVRALDKFIDLESDAVERAGDDADSRTLFALFQAFGHLQALAQYAAEEDTLDASLGRLDEKFQQGFAEVREFLTDAELDKLDLFLGEKLNRIESEAALGKEVFDVTGKVIQTGNRDDALTGLAGTETFTITLTKLGETDVVTVDLSEITGTISINAVVDLVNQKIESVTTDDGMGGQVAKYSTRFAVVTNDDGDHSIKVDGTSLETVKLGSAGAEPALYVAGNVTAFNADGVASGQLTKLDSLAGGDPARVFQQAIAGVDAAQTRIAEEAAAAAGEDEDEVAQVTVQTTTSAAAVDSEGYVYVVGQSAGSFGSQLNPGGNQDVFLTKFDSNGEVVFSRLLGAASDSAGFAIAIDSADNVIVAGRTDENLAAGATVSGTDSFVTKFNSRGDELFTYQLDTTSTDSAFALTVDGSDNIVVAGETSGAINATSGFGGGKDGFVLTLDGATGALTGSTVFGGATNESARAVAIASDGNILVAGVEDGNAVLRKLDATDLSTEIFQTSLGALSEGTISGLAVDGTSIYVAGTTGNASLNGGTGGSGHAHNGGADGFVARLNDAGSSASSAFTTFLGSTATDSLSDIVASGGKLYVAGTAGGDVEGQTKAGITDAFAAEIDGATGAINSVEQFGVLLGTTTGSAIAFSTNGSSVLGKLGLPVGTLDRLETNDVIPQTSAREGDHFFISVDGKSPKKIEIEAGDDFAAIAGKLNLVDFRRINAEVVTTSDGPTLKITAENSGEIDIIAGPAGADALRRIGLAPTKLLPTEQIFDLDDDEIGADANELGGVFGLGLDPALHIRDKTTAKFALSQIDSAISTVQRAFRSLSFDPLAAALKEQARFQGEVPAHLTKQLANFQDALFRLQSFSQSSSTGFIV